MLPDFGWSELLVVAIVLIVIVGPKDLPKMLRTFAKTTSGLRKMAGDFRRQFDDALKEAELDDVRQLAQDVKSLDPRNEIKQALNPLGKVGEDISADLKRAARDVDDATKPPSPAESALATAGDKVRAAQSKADKAKAATAKGATAKAKALSRSAAAGKPVGAKSGKTSTRARNAAAEKSASSASRAKSAGKSATAKSAAGKASGRSATAKSAAATAKPKSKTATRAASRKATSAKSAGDKS